MSQRMPTTVERIDHVLASDTLDPHVQSTLREARTFLREQAQEIEDWKKLRDADNGTLLGWMQTAFGFDAVGDDPDDAAIMAIEHFKRLQAAEARADAAEALLRSGGWQPIAMADKEADAIILTDGDTVDVGGWVSAQAQGAEPGEEYLISEGWWFLHTIDMKPTMWQPLPPLPSPPDTTRKELPSSSRQAGQATP